jgi:alpha-amylase
MKVLFAILSVIFFVNISCQAHSDVMMQAFYWDPPVDAAHLNGIWWDKLAGEIPELEAAGIEALWIPSPCKGNWGITDMGYGIYDHYDLGNFNECGTVETRFGSKAELMNLLQVAHDTSKGQRMDIYADIVMNHMYSTQKKDLERNPVVKNYMQDQAVIKGKAHAPYPTNEIVWQFVPSRPGNYIFHIRGFHLNFDAPESERIFQFECNLPARAGNSTGETPQKRYYRTILSPESEQEFQVDVPADKTNQPIEIRLTAQKSSDRKNFQWTDQTNAYYVSDVTLAGKSVNDSLFALTHTGIHYVDHGNLPNLKWHYFDFHPSDVSDSLGFPGNRDTLMTNVKWFGNDLNTLNPEVQQRLMEWGKWLSDSIGFDGYRLDFVQGYQPEMVAKWVTNLPPDRTGQQPFIVSEYFTNYADRIYDWVKRVDDYRFQGKHPNVTAFDFPLKKALTDMCNGDGTSFSMERLATASMSDNGKYELPASSVVSFAENHDTGKEHDKWIVKDWQMAYAYILFAPERPCIFYPHYFGVKQKDFNHKEFSVQAPDALRTFIEKMIKIRSNYLGGSMKPLRFSRCASADNLFVARRGGGEKNSGAILVLNNSDSQERDCLADTKVDGYKNWAGKKLINLLQSGDEVNVSEKGFVELKAPPRGISIYVPVDRPHTQK